MDQEQDLERFDVDNDFEGGQFIGGEFFYTNKRQKRQQTQDDRLYGIFAEGSDSDGDRRDRKRDKANYNKPVSFVSKGVVGKPAKEEEDAQRQADDDGGAHRPSFANLRPRSASPERPAGLGLGATPGLGLGASAGLGSTFRQRGGDSGEDDEEAVLPTAFGARIKARAAERRQAEAKQHKQEKQRKETMTQDPEFASFEKYNKGIGMKLLQKMGYKPGEGLGRNKDGMAKPIEVKLRPKGMGMGFGSRHQEDEEEDKTSAKATAQVSGPVTASVAQQGKLWKKRNADVRVKREYKTASEVLSDTSNKPFAAQPILDMRGPQARLITNLEHLNAPEESQEGSKVPLPELQHNLQLLVDLSESGIQKLDSKLRHEQDSATLLAREKSRLEQEVAHLDLQLQRMTTVLDQVARCEAATPGSNQEAHQQPAHQLSLQEVEATYKQIADEFREEYIMHNLSAAALAHALPRLQALLQGWAPLQEPSRGTAEFRRWRALLDPLGTSSMAGSVSRDGDVSAHDCYTLLLTEVVLPPVRSACTQWQPRDPEPLLGWLEAWESLLPHTALVHILDMIVMPALRRAVTEWEPRQETVPIHMWIHPWLPFLGVALEELYPMIRGKLVMALQMWHPSDNSALVMLKPWHKVFSASDWDILLAQSIIPKLAQALMGLVVNPVAQDMAPFNCVMAWADVLPTHHMASLLETGFFPKWHQVLHYWLSHTPNYDEVTRWYLGWKAAFPPALLDHERLRRQFNTALDMMNTAVDGQVPMPAQPAYASRWATEEAAPGPSASSAAAAASAASDMTLKELVQRFAAENGIQFMPKFGRIQDGLQVYAFGNTSVILDNTHSSIRALMNGRWAPVTLESLLQNNLKSSKG